MAVTIRLARAADAAAILAVYAPYVRDTVISFELEVPEAAEMARRIENVTALHPWLVCEVAGEVAGYAYASKFHPRAAYQWSVETSVYIGAEHHRKGMASGLYTALFALLRLQGFCNASAGITMPNQPSVALHEAIGFEPARVQRHIGFKQGRWLDVGYWQLKLTELPAAPASPVAIATLAGTPAFAAAMAAGECIVRV